MGPQEQWAEEEHEGLRQSLPLLSKEPNSPANNVHLVLDPLNCYILWGSVLILHCWESTLGLYTWEVKVLPLSCP